MNKQELTDKLSIWLEKYCKENYSAEYHIEVIKPSSYISRLPNESIKRIENYSSLDFKPDVLGVLTSKDEFNNVKLIFINRSISSLSLREIGEIICYSKIANPIESYLVSPMALANEVNLILLDKNMQNRILKYQDKFLKICKFDKDKNIIIFPR